MNSAKHSLRAQIDVINFWCVAVLVISAVSVAGVVGAAVVAGEFEDRNFDFDEDEQMVTEEVITETNPDGTTRVRWSEEGEASFLQIRVDGEEVETLGFVGEEATVDSSSFEVVAIYDDGSEATVESRG